MKVFYNYFIARIPQENQVEVLVLVSAQIAVSALLGSLASSIGSLAQGLAEYPFIGIVAIGSLVGLPFLLKFYSADHPTFSVGSFCFFTLALTFLVIYARIWLLQLSPVYFFLVLTSICCLTQMAADSQLDLTRPNKFLVGLNFCISVPVSVCCLADFNLLAFIWCTVFSVLAALTNSSLVKASLNQEEADPKCLRVLKTWKQFPQSGHKVVQDLIDYIKVNFF